MTQDTQTRFAATVLKGTQLAAKAISIQFPTVDPQLAEEIIFQSMLLAFTQLKATFQSCAKPQQ